MKVRMIEQGTQRTYAVIFDKDEEFVTELTSWAKESKLGGSHFTAIGAFREVTLGYFDREKKITKKYLFASKWKCSRSSAILR